MKSKRAEEMSYEKISRAMRYHYGSERSGRIGHLAIVRDRRLCYRLGSSELLKMKSDWSHFLSGRFGELAVNWRSGEIDVIPCKDHEICQAGLCLWTME